MHGPAMRPAILSHASKIMSILPLRLGAVLLVGALFIPPALTRMVSSVSASFRRRSLRTIHLPPTNWRCRQSPPSIMNPTTTFDYSKSIFPGFAIGVGMGYVDAKPPGDPSRNRLTNFHIAPVLELLRSPEHEFIFSASLDWDIGGSGSKSVCRQVFYLHADNQIRQRIRRPARYYGLSQTLRDDCKLSAMRFPAPVTAFQIDRMGGGVGVQFALPSEQCARPGIQQFIAHLAPIVEFSFSSPLDIGGGGTTGTFNPGLIWSGQHEQLAVEAIIPANHASGGYHRRHCPASLLYGRSVPELAWDACLRR